MKYVASARPAGEALYKKLGELSWNESKKFSFLFINVFLGLLLILFPFGIAESFGVPIPISNFYPTILGGVIFGIGIALYIERYGYKSGIRGLGLGGAIAINICGGLVLLILPNQAIQWTSRADAFLKVRLKL